MDRSTRELERNAMGQPHCARMLVALGRVSRDQRHKGVAVTLNNGWTLPVGHIYPLFDGSGWAVLTTMGSGLLAEDPRIVEVTRG